MINVRNIGKERKRRRRKNIHEFPNKSEHQTKQNKKKKRMRNYDYNNNNNNFLSEPRARKDERKNDLAFFTPPFSYNIDTNVNDCHE
ncbi:hypothetical protein BLA29_015086 [Euroglyphus maynei]|uniref:Uncharacterized protein n=1 Tax=Euroglyphus maynei TaxID=6958 RepID=A0A1Y3BNX5_EURMA|nr:hypothetical protein BLA29_015086 [Euroglyphus maynei]